jgi:hypothetical protein
MVCKTTLVSSLVLVLVAWVSSFATAPTVSYDPIALAVQGLQADGMPPPVGYTIRIARSGELKNGEAAHTDSDAHTIIVDISKVAAIVQAESETFPLTWLEALQIILWHEYFHTADYGEPSAPPAGLPPGNPNPTGYGNGVCSHVRLYGATIDELKVRISALADGGEIKTLCQLLGVWLQAYNSNLPSYGAHCQPPLTTKGNHVACE